MLLRARLGQDSRTAIFFGSALLPGLGAILVSPNTRTPFFLRKTPPPQANKTLPTGQLQELTGCLSMLGHKIQASHPVT